MNYAVWRVSAPDLDVDALLARFPELQRRARSWQRGVPGRDGTPHPTSGFTLSIADAESFRAALDSARDFFAGQAPVLEVLRTLRVPGLLDIGVVTRAPPSGSGPWVRNLRLNAEDLRWLAQAGLDFEITVYPPEADDAGEPRTGR